jgi:4-amino-4-deoxy-L-arabinose transferase-like glycosyltransferase
MRNGGIVFLVATALLAVLVGAPRFVSFGIALGAVLLGVACLGLLWAMGAFVPRPRDPAGEDGGGGPGRWRPWRSPDLWVVAAGAALFLPMLGAGGLWDPWETHYGEVARRMLEQDDWISMWWQNEWFYSKPVLIMWMDAIGIALVGGNPFPDGELFGATWGMRLPVATFAVFCMWGVHHFVSRRFGTRAGVVSAVALGTMPTFALLAHQTMTDMPYVAPMSVAMCFLALALDEDDARLVRGRVIRLGPLGEVEIGAHQALIVALVVFVLPFALYLLPRSMSYVQGSLGQENVRLVPQVVLLPLAVVGVAALVGLGWLLWTLRSERRVRRIYLLAAYLLVGLAVLGKVLPGIVLPAMVLFLYLVVTGRWSLLRTLEIGRGLVVFAVVCLPWYLAMVIRHGQPFIDRIIFHDVVNRAVVGVHGDTGNMGYYLSQIGYGVFPWLVLVPLGLFGFSWTRREVLVTPAGRARSFVLIWLVAFFVFFSAVMTKFHHYVFPALVPLAVLVGIAFDDLLARRLTRPEPLVLIGVVLTAIVGLDLVRGPGSSKPGYERFVDLFIYNYRRVWPEGPQYDYTGVLTVLVCCAVGVALLLLIPRSRAILGWGTVVFAFVFGGWLLDCYMPAVGDHWSQAGLIAEYYERRESADERLVAYQMNWKGENFYTGNRVIVHVSLDTDEFESWVRAHAGERHFFITERSRFEGLRSTLNRAVPGAGDRMEEVGAPPGPDRGRLCNKFRMGVTTLE